MAFFALEIGFVARRKGQKSDKGNNHKARKDFRR